MLNQGIKKNFLASLEDVQVQNTWRDRVWWHLSYQFRYCVNVCICVSLYARICGSIHFVLPSVFHRPEYLQNVNVSLTSVWHCQPWTNFVLSECFLSFKVMWHIDGDVRECVRKCYDAFAIADICELLSLSVLWHCWLRLGKSIWSVKVEWWDVLAWLSISSKV